MSIAPSGVPQARQHEGDEFCDATVPEGKTVSGLHVGLVLIGISITISAFLTGSRLGLELGLTKVVIAVISGSAVLTLIACATAMIAARSRLTTYMIIQFPFGTKGARIVNMVIATTIFGWFTVTCSFFGEAIQLVVRESSKVDIGLTWLIIGGSVLVVLTTLFGFRAIDRFSRWTVPPLCAGLVYLSYLALEGASITELRSFSGSGMTVGRGITAVVGSYIVAAVILPDYCRFVRSTKDGVFAAVLNFGTAYPLLLIMLAVVALHAGEADFIAVLIKMGFGAAGVMLVIFATWTTNIGNLYSNSLVLRTIFTAMPLRGIVLIAGLIGTLLAISGLAKYFIEFLMFLGIAIPPVAGIYVADYFLVRAGNYNLGDLSRQPSIAYPAFAAWLVASGVSAMTNAGWFALTTIPACDAIALAFLLYLAQFKLAGARRQSP